MARACISRPRRAHPVRFLSVLLYSDGNRKRKNRGTAIARGGGSLDRQTKSQIIEEYRGHPSDTGSTEVQVAVLSRRISDLTGHLQVHRHDHATRRGLLMLVGQRRRLLRYLRRKDVGRYQSLIASLGLRR
ncbi:MAG: 30S ribosomal protein S15 [Dehalococcoidia bacterium]|nr:30S ribosomal protein S15 [Dehalococcoidia bacterium]